MIDLLIAALLMSSWFVPVPSPGVIGWLSPDSTTAAKMHHAPVLHRR